MQDNSTDKTPNKGILKNINSLSISFDEINEASTKKIIEERKKYNATKKPQHEAYLFNKLRSNHHTPPKEYDSPKLISNIKPKNIADPGKEKSVLTHKYDDYAHIFLDPKDIKKPRYIPKKIEHMWIPFVAPQEEAIKLKGNLNNLISLSLDERAKYMQLLTTVRLINKDDCKKDKCDKALIGQRGLFARIKIPAFTVIGVYSGVFLTCENDYLKLCEHYDPNDISDYLFRVAEEHQWPKISAYNCGNRLTIANAASNYAKGFEKGIETVFHRQSLVPVYGKTLECPFENINQKSECPDMLFLATCRDVEAGEQLLYDYGATYWM